MATIAEQQGLHPALATTEQHADKAFKLEYSALTFPSGQIEPHTLIIDKAPSEERVRNLFSTIMNADTTTLHSLKEIAPDSDTVSRTINFPKASRWQ